MSCIQNRILFSPKIMLACKITSYKTGRDLFNQIKTSKTTTQLGRPQAISLCDQVRQWQNEWDKEKLTRMGMATYLLGQLYASKTQPVFGQIKALLIIYSCMLSSFILTSFGMVWRRYWSFETDEVCSLWLALECWSLIKTSSWWSLVCFTFKYMPEVLWSLLLFLHFSRI